VQNHRMIPTSWTLIASALSLSLSLLPAVAGAQSQEAQPLAAAGNSHFQSISATFKTGDALDALFEYRTFLGSAAAQFAAGEPNRAAVPTTPSCLQPPTRLVAWFPLNERQGVTAAELTRGLDGTLVNGPVPVSGMIQGGRRFDGVNDYVEVAPAAATGFNTGTSDLSIVAWAKLEAQDTIRGVRVLVERRQAFPLRGYSLYLYNGKLGAQLADASGYTNFGSELEVPRDGKWHLVVVTVDRSSPQGGTFYLDGVAGAPFNASLRPGDLDSGAPLRLGSTTLSSAPGSVFNGSLDDVQIYSRRLVAQEVSTIFAAKTGGLCPVLGPQEIKIHVVCDNGKSANFDVTGLPSAYKAYDWIEDNCGHSVTISW
jgi:hypothetical protein